METKQHTLAGYILIMLFVVFLAWYFWASYRGHRVALQIQERALTVHDDLFAIDGRHDGSRVAVGKFGLILLTKDGGKSWQEPPSGTTRALSATSFADDQRGLIVGSGGTILATSDGGNSWKAQNSGTKDQLLGVQALSPTSAFVVGAFGTLLSTSDGGQSWVKQKLSWERLIPSIIKESGYLEPNLNAVHFVNAQIGWIVGEFGLVLQTKDGGQTWASQNHGADLPQLFAVVFRDERNGWAIGQDGILMKTIDGGKRWVRGDLGTKRNLYGISLDGHRGVIVGDGVVFRSHDGGSSWGRVESVPEDRWLSGVTMKSREAIAVGQAGAIQMLDLDKGVQTGTGTP
ncbi:MAG: hypothetical protein HY695_32745 [Deltaproteobacteria bacterium]|nr:hypothetical protein [Deltaproteobacteria bacterium]